MNYLLCGFCPVQWSARSGDHAKSARNETARTRHWRAAHASQLAERQVVNG